MPKWIPPIEVARRRIIRDFAISFDGTAGKGKVVAGAQAGRSFDFTFDDVLDLAQLAETLMFKTAGKLLRPNLRPKITNRAALRPTRVVGGDYSLYDGKDGQPLPPQTLCEVTGEIVPTHYLLVEIEGNVWHNWFGRLDELAKCLYIIVREAQGDPYVPQPMAMVGARGPISTSIH